MGGSFFCNSKGSKLDVTEGSKSGERYVLPVVLAAVQFLEFLPSEVKLQSQRLQDTQTGQIVRFPEVAKKLWVCAAAAKNL